MRTSFTIAGLLALLFLLTVCGDDGPGKPKCETTADCAGGKICAGGVCDDCTADVQCQTGYGEGYTCAGGSCQPPSCPEGQIGCPCLTDGTCTAGECVNDVCTDCERGSEDCVCFANDTCSAGYRCRADGICEVCPQGEEGCPCRSDDSCDGSLECQNGVCAPSTCPAGTQGCPCRSDDSCDGNLFCLGNGICTQCSNDIVGCPCEAGACINDLVCDAVDDLCRDALTCADLACVAHQECQEGPGEDAICLESCETGYVWDPAGGACLLANCIQGDPASILDRCTAENRVCVEDVVNGATCGACLDYFIDDAGTCRAVVTCADLTCDAEHRDCTAETVSTDAVCGACSTGYTEEGGVCVTATCTPGVAGSIADQCAAEFRECVEDAVGATCGACIDGYAENAQGVCEQTHACEELNCADLNRLCEGDAPFNFCGACFEGTTEDPDDPTRCRPPLTCLDITCPADEFCLEGAPGVDAHCEAALCQDGYAYGGISGDQCVQCTLNCDAANEGETGRIWPYTLLNSNRCICETEDGYYWDTGDNIGAHLCDADADGWMRDSAKTYIESPDPALSQNARCHLRTIDRFVLENEYRQRLQVYLCTGSPRFSTLPCAQSAPLDLYETERNDDQVQLDLSPYVPSYEQGGVGRKPLAKEVNSLTRACVTKGGDYNDNQVADMAEYHRLSSLVGNQAVYVNFTYYIELHRAWYERGTDSLLGKYIIQERSRCDIQGVAFPLHYGGCPPDQFTCDGGSCIDMAATCDGSDDCGDNSDEQDCDCGPKKPTSDYWRSCTRDRDAAFDSQVAPGSGDWGMEFARWSCDQESPGSTGTCPIPPPLVSTEVPGEGSVRLHGLCETGIVLPPIDAECMLPGAPWPCVDGGVWRGMSHHSQFKCVAIGDPSSTTEPTLDPGDFTGTTPLYAFNRCRIDGTAEAPPEEPNPDYALLACEVGTPPGVNEVGFAAATYRPVGPGGYQLGCLDEWSPTSYSGSPVRDPNIYPWRSLCSGWVDNPTGVMGKGGPAEYGRLLCGCTEFFGGLSCEIGCPQDQLHFSPGYDQDPASRCGTWVCADFSATGFDMPDPFFGPALVSLGAEAGPCDSDADCTDILDGPDCIADSQCSPGWICHPSAGKCRELLGICYAPGGPPGFCRAAHVLRGEIPNSPTDGQPMTGTVTSADTCTLDEHCDPGWRCNGSLCEQQYVIR